MLADHRALKDMSAEATGEAKDNEEWAGFGYEGGTGSAAEYADYQGPWVQCLGKCTLTPVLETGIA